MSLFTHDLTIKNLNNVSCDWKCTYVMTNSAFNFEGILYLAVVKNKNMFLLLSYISNIPYFMKYPGEVREDKKKPGLGFYDNYIFISSLVYAHELSLTMKNYLFNFQLNTLIRYYQTNIYLFKVNWRNLRKRCEICSELKIKNQNDLSGVSVV